MPAARTRRCGRHGVFLMMFLLSALAFAGPYQLLINTPTFELICSIGPDAAGDDSCFGNAYVDIAWTDTVATVTTNCRRTLRTG